MAIGTNSEVKDLTYWDEGMPSEDIQATSTNLSEVTYWLDGMPYVTIYTSAAPPTARTSDFMPFFWGIG